MYAKVISVNHIIILSYRYSGNS